MLQTWRWFGPVDKVSVEDARQAGAEGIVSALHHLPPGEVWSEDEIARRQGEVRAGGLEWRVVESLPVSEEIKLGVPLAQAHYEAWRVSLGNLAAAGITTICYNFMPVLDWTRTALHWQTPRTTRTMRFDFVDFAVFDLHIFGRDGAADYSPAIVEAAAKRHATMSDADRHVLMSSVGAGLPGEGVSPGVDALRRRVAAYAGMDAAQLRANLVAFLEEVVPTAEQLGMRICCHPDDPPWSLLGLPRVMSTEADFAAVFDAVPSLANGITFCTGSLGARPDNDLPGMARRLAPRIHFAHLRNVRREGAGWPVSFFEDEHLEGGTDMVAVVAALLAEEKRRAAEGRADAQIPMRPDHGQEMLNDLARGAQPGYPAIGRLRALAELRGVMKTLSHPEFGRV
jgi:mannonate dehydratase